MSILAFFMILVLLYFLWFYTRGAAAPWPNVALAFCILVIVLMILAFVFPVGDFLTTTRHLR